MQFFFLAYHESTISAYRENYVKFKYMLSPLSGAGMDERNHVKNDSKIIFSTSSLASPHHHSLPSHPSWHCYVKLSSLLCVGGGWERRGGEESSKRQELKFHHRRSSLALNRSCSLLTLAFLSTTNSLLLVCCAKGWNTFFLCEV